MDMEILIDGIIHKLFTHNTYMPDDDTLSLLHKEFDKNEYTITAFTLSKNADTDMYQHELASLIPKYAKRHCKAHVWFYRTESYDNLLLFNHNHDFDVAAYIHEIQDYFATRHKCNTYWGVSRECHTLSEFIFARKEAVVCLKKSQSAGNDSIIAYTDSLTFPSVDTFEYYYPDTAAAILYKAVRYNDRCAIEFIIKTLSDENLVVRSLSQGELLKLHNAVTQTLMQLNPAKHNFSDKLLKLNQNVIINSNNPTQYFNLLLSTCLDIACELDNHKNIRKKLPVHDIQSYILANYNDASLNLSGTARSFNVSEGYMSSSFKDSLGICFAEYLENIRIEKSCELLKSSDLNIVDIAEQTGYNSVYSFRRAFKRIMHISPSDYRKQTTK